MLFRALHLATNHGDTLTFTNNHKKLSCRWQTARRICANAMKRLT